ncbi:MAG: HNH endonuclease family protein [Micromonosporaceae bacterium]
MLLNAALAAALATAGCGVVDIDVDVRPGHAASGKPGTPPPSGSGNMPKPPSTEDSHDQLAALTVAAAGSMRGYDRERFPHWSSQGENCTTREVVLERDGEDVAVDESCAPTAGRWYSGYDDRWFDEPRELDIDHVVPLANAWRSGADEWTDAEREAFANDLERGQLIAVSAGSNRAKGDQDPSEWRPTNTEVWCDYAGWWIDVKHHYQLTITDAEKSALGEMLGTC